MYDNEVSLKYISFENIIIDILKQICNKTNKKIYTSQDVDKHFLSNKMQYFDGFAPNGIFDNLPTFIEIKYSTDKRKIKGLISNYIQRLKKYLNFYDGVKLVIIVPVDDFNEQDINNNIEGLEIEVWNKQKIVKMLYNYPIDLLALQYANIDFLSYEFFEKLAITHFKEKNETLKSELRNAISDFGVTLVLGTGVSIDFKALSWDNLVERLYASLPSEKIFKSKDESLKKIGNDRLSISEYAKQNIDSKTYVNIVYDALYNKYSSKMSKKGFTLIEVVNIISKRNKKNKKSKVNKVITYNYDNFLEILLDESKIEFNSLICGEDFLNSFVPIYHVHGFLPYKSKVKERVDFLKNIVLTEDDYFKLYNNSSHWQVAIQLESFKDDICLFVGNSITDFNEKKLLNYTIQKGKKHYAIFHKENLSIADLSRISAYYMATCNVGIIWVDNIADIAGVLRTL